jgi:hypothetical protein
MRALGAFQNCGEAPSHGSLTFRGACGTRLLCVGALLLSTALFRPAVAQGGGPYAIPSFAIAGGGATLRTDGAEPLEGTIGQAAAGRLLGGAFVVNGGFWVPAVSGAPTATPSTAATGHPPVSATPTPSSTPTPRTTVTVTRPSTPSPTVSAGTPSRTPKSSPSAVPTPAATASPTPSPGPARGDANCDGRTSAADLPALLINIATGQRAICGLDDVNDDQQVDSADIELLTRALFDDR